MYQVYIVENKLNGKMYIGSTERELKIRWQRHLAKANEGSLCSLHKAIRKYGRDNFDIRMIVEYPTREAMLAGEVEYIAHFDTYKSRNGYNDTPGGDGGNTNGGKKFSDEWRVGISKSLSGKAQLSKRRFSSETEVEICKLYVEEEKSAYALEKQFGCPRTTIADILKRYNIEVRRSNYTGHSNGRNIFSPEQELEICNKYQEGSISRSELVRQYGCGKTTIRDILLRHNVKL
ncbi:MAG TPA: GIY-YIG nuclease family protein [Nitrososphaeraceae archaeon]|nr:GIY-YIG nuclease family protein [Nitrososphaeraceae archaeon]